MSRRRLSLGSGLGRIGMTLAEVAIAGALIGTSVLGALSLIPSGLRMQDASRMRAVAAATAMYLSAKAGTASVGASLTDALIAVPAGVQSATIRFSSSGVVKPDPSPSTLRMVDGGSGSIPVVGDLARRLVFSVQETDGSGSDLKDPGGTIRLRVVTAWLLGTDPQTTSGSLAATYLATFTEYRP